MTRHSLILLSYKRADLIEARINEICDLIPHRDDTEVIVFDNGSDNTVRLVLADLTLRRHHHTIPIRYHFQDPNIGFGRAFNAAVKHTEGEIIHLISNDVAIKGDITYPLENLGQRVIACHQLIKHDAGWNHFGEAPPIPYPAGYYIAMYRTLWDELEGFDEQFYPYDCEDLDLGMRALQDPTIELVEFPGLPINHTVAGTIGYSPERFDHTCRMRVLFAKKWGLENRPERP